MNKRIDAPEGVLISKKEEEKHNLTVQGINLEDVSQVCARIQQSTVIQDKDLRAFLDGIYVSEARQEFTDWKKALFKSIYASIITIFCFISILIILFTNTNS